MNYEVEQKFPLSSVEQLETIMARLEATFDEPIIQVDRYFNHPARDFAETDEAFRLRQVGSQNWVTYKGPRLDGTTKTRQELELPLGDGPQVLDEFAEMWIALGFRPAGTVSKRRRRTRLLWAGRDCELVHDTVDGLGEYVELEMICEANELDETQAAITDLAAKLGLTASERRSYLELVLQSQGDGS